MVMVAVALVVVVVVAANSYWALPMQQARF